MLWKKKVTQNTVGSRPSPKRQTSVPVFHSWPLPRAINGRRWIYLVKDTDLGYRIIMFGQDGAEKQRRRDEGKEGQERKGDGGIKKRIGDGDGGSTSTQTANI